MLRAQYSIDYSHSVVLRISRTYSSCITEILYLPINSLFYSPLKYLALTILVPVSVGLTILDTLYKWNHEVFVLL